MNEAIVKEMPRIIISGGILLLFAFAFARNPSSQLLIGAIISMATSASNYWLGTSKGSTDKAEAMAAATDDGSSTRTAAAGAQATADAATRKAAQIKGETK